MRVHICFSFVLSFMMALILPSSSSENLKDVFVTKGVWVALFPRALRMTLPQCSPEKMSLSKFGFASGFTRLRTYAQNSTKRTWPMVAVNLVELIHGLLPIQVQAQRAQASFELASIDPAIVTSVD